MNGPKTKYLVYNTEAQPPLVTRHGTVLEPKDDFKYLGSWVDNSAKDISVRKALAWKALNDMENIWKSNMNPNLKKRFFVATVESILLYGCESWTMTETMEKSLSGTLVCCAKPSTSTGAHIPPTLYYMATFLDSM